MSTIQVSIPDDILSTAQDMADRHGVTVDEVLSKAVIDFMRVERRLSQAKRPVTQADRDRFKSILDKAPDVPPVPGDELPE